MGHDKRIVIESLLPGDKANGEKRLARSVIATALLDAFSRDAGIRSGAEFFLLGLTPDCETIRNHWFRTAEIGLPDVDELLAGLEYVRQAGGIAKVQSLTVAWRLWRNIPDMEEEP